MAVSLRSTAGGSSRWSRRRRSPGRMELIAASRIIKAQQRARRRRAVRPSSCPGGLGTSPSARLQRRPPADCASRRTPKRAAMLIVTQRPGSGRGLLLQRLKEGERLAEMLREEGKEVVPYVVGRKGVGYYRFRGREVGGSVDRLLRRSRRTTTPRRSARRCSSASSSPPRAGSTRSTSFTDGRNMPSTRCTWSTRRVQVDAGRRSRTAMPAAAARRSSRRAGAPRGEVAAAATSSSRPPRRCSTRCCRATSRAGSTTALLQRGGLRAGRPAAGHEVGDRQRRGADQDVHPAGQRGPPGGDHPGDQRDRRRRGRAGRATRRE